MSGAFRYGPEIELTDTLRGAIAELDAAGAERAAQIASEGARDAELAGFEAVEILVEPAPESDWAALLDLARRVEAQVIVTGATGHTALQGLGIGGVARRLVSHADRPVLVVPRKSQS